jgi:hypothetical protein
MADPSLDPGQFHTRFERWAGRVRRRLAGQHVVAGLAVGLALGALVAALLWWLRLGELRPWAAALGALGAAVGAVVGARQRWSDQQVALYLDARLEAKEAISTAIELRTEAERTDGAREVVVRDAARALDGGDPRRARPRVLEAWHGLAPIGAAAVVWLSLVPLPPAPAAPPTDPGADLIQKQNLAGLDKIEALEKLDAKTPEQRERLKQLAEEAKKLRADLGQGIEKREALARIAKLRDDVAAERLKFSDEKNRPGLEAAVGKLAESPNMKDAAKALGDGDLVEFDREMQKLANSAEKASREEAKKKLEEAAKAARDKGSKQLADALDEQRRAFEEREAKGEALRELAKALEGQGKLDEQTLEDLKEFGESGSPEAQKRLAESLNKALEGLSEEERKKLADNLKKRIEEQQKNGQPGADPMTKQQLEDLAKKLASPEGQKELEQQLKELAKQDPSGDAEREKGLDDAERGGADAQKELGGMPMPMESGESCDNPGSKPGDGKKPGNQGGAKDPKQAQGGPGSKKDDVKGTHDGKTDPVETKELRSKAQAKLNPGAPMHGSSLGRAPSKPGETANQAGNGALGQAAPGELSGVERSEVPEEYREQVGRYFQP